MTIRKYARNGAVAMIALVVVGGALAAWNVNTIRMGGPLQTSSQQASDLVADILPPPAYILEAFLETTLLHQNPGEVEVRSNRLQNLKKNFETRSAYWRASDLEPGIKEPLTEGSYAPAKIFWAEVEANFIPAVRAGDQVAIDASYQKLAASYAEHRRMIDVTVAAAATYQQRVTAESQTSTTLAMGVLGGLGLLILLVVSGASLLIVRKIVAPLSNLEEVTMKLAAGAEAVVPDLERPDELGGIARALEHYRKAAEDRTIADASAAAEKEAVVEALVAGLAGLARGDMTSEIRVTFPPSYARAKENFTAAATSLRHMIQAVVENAESIREGTGEIAAASEDLARRTESNAASLEQSSAALVQIDDRLKTTTAGSISTVARADQAIATVANGRTTADEAMQAMSRVSSSAKGIDSVIEGVDKIAFQTRVLAMNAAVEAGRAGDAGRGFAVVADLVSALAMRAEEEAKRARDQLTVTQAEILTAVSAVQRVDGSLVAIASDVEVVHGLLGKMASDNQAQSLAVTEITAAIASMDRTTQQNAAMVEQTSATARSLTTEATALATAAGAFEFERRVNHITPIIERRRMPNKTVKAKKAPAPPASTVTRTPVRSSSGRPMPQKLVVVPATNANDWSDF